MLREFRFSRLCCTLVLLVLNCSLRAGELPAPGLTVHEWGTFTSLAAPDGSALPWQPLAGPTDLPCFVFHLRDASFKDGLSGTVRMETPVLYFYSREQTNVSVKVGFPDGSITEWYPAAARSSGRGGIQWPQVTVLPTGQSFGAPPSESRASHYYAARETAASPLLVSTPNGVQTEKFLFYRGVADFQPPVTARLQQNKVEVRAWPGEHSGTVVVFENQAGRIGYRLSQVDESSAVLERPTLGTDLSSLRAELERALTESGLFPDEAHAMLETWRDSWFEEGARLFYILSGPALDPILPLALQPAPARIQRVFVGRIELITPEVKQTVLEAARTNTLDRMAPFGRFLEPILSTLLREQPTLRKDIQLALDFAYNNVQSNAETTCPAK